MSRAGVIPHPIRAVACALPFMLSTPVAARAQSALDSSAAHLPPYKLALYGLRITPSGTDAEEFGRPGWGGGIRLVVAPPVFARGLGVVAGFDVANLLDRNVTIFDPHTLLRIEQNTSQYFMRCTLGGEIGPHGHGFLRPFAGADIAVHIYTIGTTLTIPDDNDPSRSIQQDLGSETHAAFGYDFALGLDLQVRHFSLEGGARFLKSFNVPQQLGSAGAVFIHPGYLQVFFGVAISGH